MAPSAMLFLMMLFMVTGDRVSGTVLAYNGRMQRRGNAILNKNLGNHVKEIASRYLSEGDAIKLVKMGDPKGDIIQALDDLEKELIGEQIIADRAFATVASGLNSSIAQNKMNVITQQKKLKDANADIVELTAQIGVLSSHLDDLKADLGQTSVHSIQKTAELASVTKTHDGKIASLNGVIAAHYSSIASVQTLSGMVGNFSFNDVLLELNSYSAGFLHRSEISVTNLIVRAITTLEDANGQVHQSDPTKTQIKDKLLGILEKIISGLQHSLQLYQADKKQCDADFTAVSTQLNTLLAGYASHANDISTQINVAIANSSGLGTKLKNAKSNAEAASEAITSVTELITTLQEQLGTTQSNYNRNTASRRNDLNDLEKARQYVNENIQGMTVAEMCHPEAPDCPRCLYGSHCKNGEVCGSDALCVAAVAPVNKGGSVADGDDLSISCDDPTTKITKVVFASFGTSSGVFPKFVKNSRCDASSSTAVVSATCINQATCVLEASTTTFGDPCPDSPKSLDVVVQCS